MNKIAQKFKEFYDTLPSPYNEQATFDEKFFKKTGTGRMPLNIKQAIHQGFNWAKSNQGSVYWGKLYHDLLSNRIQCVPFYSKYLK